MREVLQRRCPVKNRLLCMQKISRSGTIVPMSKKARKPRIGQLACSLLQKISRPQPQSVEPRKSVAPPLPRSLRRVALETASSSLKLASGALQVSIIGLEVLSDITPAVRMARRNRLPHNMAAGILGAEVATWAAIWPSLLPRPWWVTALNVP